MSTETFLRREPVVNRHKAIIATRLIVHADKVSDAAAALLELGDIWPTARSVMVGLAGCTPTLDLLAWPPPLNAMIEIPASTLAEPATQALIERLHHDGIALSLAHYQPGMALPDMPFRFLLADAVAHPRLDAPPALPLAQCLADPAAFDGAITQGYAGAAGWFFLHGAPPAGPLRTSHAQIVRVLNLVRKNAQIGLIEDALKQDITISYKLLKYINSPAYGLGKEIQSFRHAVTLLGYDKLNKWLSLLLVTSSRNPIAPALMQTAIARGRFMEIVAANRFPPPRRDNLFIVGAFSLLDILFGAALSDILAAIDLPAAITAALTRRSGEFAPFLALALACENENPALLIELTNQLGLSAATVNHAQLEALAFADSVQPG